MKTGTEFTSQLASWYEIPPQGTDEDEMAFRRRVSTTLRNQGKIIEAHEAYTNARYDDPEHGNGVLGAVACAMQNASYSGDVEAEQIAGDYIRNKPEDTLSPAIALVMMGLFGRR